MKRFLKRYLRLILPQRLLDYIKHRMEKRIGEGADLDLALETSDSVIRCVVDRRWSFLAPINCQGDFYYHLLPEGRPELAGVARLAIEGGTLFDLGAHAGIVSAMFCAAKAGNKAYSFEPSPFSVERLKAIRSLNHLEDRMFIEPVGIGERRATVDMLLDPGSGYIQTQAFAHSMQAGAQTIQIPIESIPDAAARLNVIPDIIKLDIEGYEYEAVKGAQAFLAKHQPVILFELHLNYIEERGLSGQTVVEMLSECGYSFFTYGETQLRPKDVYDSPLKNLRLLLRAR